MRKLYGLVKLGLCILLMPLLCSAADFSVKVIGDYGNVTVMEFSGNYDGDKPDGTPNSEPRMAIAKEFFKTHKDEYDFIVIFTNFDFAMPGLKTRGFYQGVKNDIQGIGDRLFDNTQYYGSSGRLQGTIDVGNISNLVLDPLNPGFESTLELFGHEYLHRWAAYIKFRDRDGQLSKALLGRDGMHWSFLLDTGASVMYGNKWQDNGNGTFTSVQAMKYLSPLDLYLMGFIDKSQVPPMLLIENPDIDVSKMPQVGTMVSGTARYITIDDIIAAEGERVPSSKDAPKSFKAAFILLTSPGAFSGEELYGLENVRNSWITRFSVLTDGQGILAITPTLMPDIPVNPGKPPIPDTPRTLPPSLEAAVKWLAAAQQYDGNWMDMQQTSERETAEVLYILRKFDTARQNYATGLQWLNARFSVNTDYLSRKIIVNVTGGQDVSLLVNDLALRQNSDGGWGSDRGYASNAMDTALAVRALAEAGYAEQTVLAGAISYLKMVQSADGGWGAGDGGSSIETTSNVLSVFNRYRNGYEVRESIARGLTLLSQKQNSDGGFGSSPSTIYETALAAITLAELDAPVEARSRALAYLLSKQQENGSWKQSVYQTAVAVNAIYKATVDPDLSIKAEDITVIPATITSVPANITLQVSIANLGRTEVPQAVVAIYDGAIAPGSKVAEQVAAFPGQASVTLTFPLTVTDGKEHRYYVVIDPDNQIRESNKSNNSAVKVISPQATYDFEVLASDMTISPSSADLNQDVTITAKIRNKGTMNAYSVKVKYFIDEPQGAFDIATATIDLPAGATVTSQITWKTSKGGENMPLAVVIDPLNTFTETTKANNKAVAYITVKGSTDPNLSITYNDISVTPSPVNERGTASIKATVRNSGFSAASNIKVNFYRGVPGADGLLLGTRFIDVLGVNESRQVSLDWSNIAESGEKIIYIQVDPDNQIKETSKDDNNAFVTLNILSLPDLAISPNSITFSPPAPKDGDIVSINVVVKNLGQQSVSNVNVRALEGGNIIGTQIIQAIGGNSQSVAAFTFNTTGKKGPHQITVIADPDNQIIEQSKDNNSAVHTLGVQDSNLWITEPYFSPNGDGIKDSTQFFFRLATAQSIKIVIVNRKGQAVRTFSGSELESTAGGNITWDGMNDEGAVVADGQYQIKVLDTSGTMLGSLLVVVDNNMSPITEAIGTKYLLNTNMTCMLPDLYNWQWFPNESGILAYIGYNNKNTPEYPVGLYTVSPDGADIMRILPNEWVNGANPNVEYAINGYEVNKAGDKLAVLLYKFDNQNSRRFSQMWTLGSDGSNLKLIADIDITDNYNPINELKWSQDGKYIVYRKGYPIEIWIIRPDGTGSTLIDTVDGDVDLEMMTWSNDGNKLAYAYSYYSQGSRGFYIRLNDLTGNKQDIMRLNGIDLRSAYIDWLNDQKLLVSNYYRDADYNYMQRLLLADINEPGNVITLSDNAGGYSINSTQRTFVYVDYIGGREQLKQRNISGNEVVLYEASRFNSDNISIVDLRWTSDGTKLAFIDRSYEKISDCEYKGYLITLDMKTGVKTSVRISDSENLCIYPTSYHIYTQDGDKWVERGVLHYKASLETKVLDLSRYLSRQQAPYKIRIVQQGGGNAKVDYIALSVNGIQYRPTGARNTTRGQDILEKILLKDDKSEEAYNSALELTWDKISAGGRFALVMRASETAAIQSGTLRQMGMRASMSTCDGCAEVRYAGRLQWLSDNITLVAQDHGSNGLQSFFINSLSGEKIYLSIKGWTDVLVVSPLGRYITYNQGADETTACYNRGYWDFWSVSSLLNLTASLQIRKEKTAVILKGVAADLNFEGYKLEYADIRSPQQWNLVAPPSDVPVINSTFTTWIPPYEGVFYVQLTVWDRAGNIAKSRKRVSWGITSSITNVYKSTEIFSPNGDGIKDSVALNYTVLEPVHLEFNIYDEGNNLVRTYRKDYTDFSIDSIVWDGRNEAGNVVPDGTYRIKIYDYEFPVVVDNTPPNSFVYLTELKQYCDQFGCSALQPELKGHAYDSNLKSYSLQYGLGENPSEWLDLSKGTDALITRDPDGQPILNPIQDVNINFQLPEQVEMKVGRVTAVLNKKLRIATEDFAGNKSSSTSDFMEEQFVLFSWFEDKPKGVSKNLKTYRNGAGIILTVADDGVPVKSFVTAQKVYIGGVFTYRKSLRSMTIQYGAKKDVWTDGPAIHNPAIGDFSILWDKPSLTYNNQVRVKAVDADGQVYYSNVIRSAYVFDVTCGLCREQSGMDVKYSLYGEPESVEVYANSPSDPDYKAEKLYLAYYKDKGDSISEVGFCFLPPILLQPYTFRLKIKDSLGYEYSGVQQYPCSMINMLLVVTPPVEAACNSIADGVWTLELQDVLAINKKLESVSYYIDKGKGMGMELFQEVIIEPNRRIQVGLIRIGRIQLQTINMSEGRYPVKAVLKYIDMTDNLPKALEAASYIDVDRMPPISKITYPGKTLTVCPVEQIDMSGNWFGIPIEGEVTDNTGIRGYQLFYALGDAPFGWGEAMTRSNGKSFPIKADGLRKGRLGTWDVTDKKGDEYSLRLKVVDTSGNTSCSVTSFRIDRVVEIVGLRTDKSLFSPNGDGQFDDVAINYEIDKYSTVDIKVFRLLKQADNTYIPDTTVLKTIASGIRHLGGSGTERWDGTGDVGDALADGKYAIKVFAKDSCGNTSSRWIGVDIDNTPPNTVITYPRPPDKLGNIIEVKGTAEDPNFQSYVLEASSEQTPENWLVISVSANPAKDEIIGKWNTYGLSGVWTLRLTAYDRVGNKSSYESKIDLGQRQVYIKDLAAAPNIFSPNNDGRLDTSNISFNLNDACKVQLDIIDSAAVIKKSFTATTSSGGIYNFIWDGKDSTGNAVPDGAYTARLSVALVAYPLVRQEEAITVVVDNTLPVIDLKMPLNNSYIATDINVMGSMTDANISSYSISYAGAGGSGLVDSGKQGRLDYLFGTLSSLQEGTYVLNARADDRAGNSAERIITFTVDRTAPKVSLDSPKDGELYGFGKGAISISGSIKEQNLEVYSLRYGVGENPLQWTELSGGNSIPLSTQLLNWKVGKTDGIADGLYTISLYAKDKAGLTGEAKAKIIIDNTAPEVAIAFPGEGSYVIRPLDIKGTASDLNFDSFTLELSEGTCSNAYKWSAIRTASVAVKDGVLHSWQQLPADGDYCLRLTAVDKLGNKSDAKVYVKVDTHPPAPPVLSGKVENKINGRLIWSKNAEPDLAGYNLYRDGQKINAALLTDITYMDQNLKEGTYVYSVTAVDMAGGESKASNDVKLKVDLTGPDAKLRLPQNGSKVSSLVDIKGTAYSMDDFKQYKVYVGQGVIPNTWTVISTSTVPVSYGTLAQWDTIMLSEGLFSIKLEAEDANGNIGTDQVTVTIDNTPPAAPVLISANSNNSDITATWRANAEPDLAGYLLYRNDQLVNASGIVVGDMKPYLITGTTYLDKLLPDGKYKYYLIAMDQAGNLSGTSNTIEIILDTHPPRATIIEPKDRDKIQDKVLLKAESSDTDIAAVQFQYKKLSDGTWINLGAAVTLSPYMTYFDPKTLQLAYADYQFRAVATDKGNKTDPAPPYITLTYTDLTPPEIPRELKALTDARDVNLTWMANTEADLAGYYVYRTNNGYRTRITSSAVKETIYQDKGLSDADYGYEITALDTYGNESKPSNIAYAKIYAPKLSQPYTPTGQKKLALQGSDAAANANLELFNEINGTMTSAGTVTSDSQGKFGFAEMVLSNGENRMTAKATDNTGNKSRMSDMVVVVYNEAPATPTELAATVNEHKVVLAWNANKEDDLSGYNIFRNGIKLNNEVEIRSGQAEASSFRFGNYRYSPTRAFDSDIATYWMSDDTYDLFTTEYWQLSMPTAELINRVEISWLLQANWEGKEILYAGRDYEIQAWSGYAWITVAKINENAEKQNIIHIKPSYRTDKIRIWITDATVDNYVKKVAISEVRIFRDNLVVEEAYSDADVSDGSYRYAVSAVDYYGFESSRTDETKAVVGDIEPPAAPVNLTAVAAGSNINLNWDKNLETDLAGYNVYRNSPQGWAKINVSPVLNNSYADISLLNGAYTYRVTAVDVIGNESLPSNTAIAQINTQLPLAPINLKVVVVKGGGALNIAWDYSGTATGFNLYRSTVKGGPYIRVNNSLLSATSYQDIGLNNGTLYYYVASAVDAIGNESVYSNEGSGMPKDDIAPAKPIIFWPTTAVRPITLYSAETDVSGMSEAGVNIELFRNGYTAGRIVALATDTTSSFVMDNNIWSAAVSPDLKLIAYLTGSTLWLKDLLSGSIIRIADGCDSPVWSSDGKRLAYAAYDNNNYSHLYIYDVSSGKSAALTGEAAFIEQSLSWTLDTKKIAFVSNRGGNFSIWIKDIDTGAMVEVPTGIEVSSAKLSPDGNIVAYFDMGTKLYIADIKTGQSRPISDITDGYSIEWSPEGSRMLYIAENNNNYDIFVYNLSAQSAVAITNSELYELNAVWSPDGSKVAFTREAESGKQSVFIAASDGTSIASYQQNISNLVSLSWMPAGAIAVLGGNSLHITYPAGFFTFRNVAINEGESTFHAKATDLTSNMSEPSEPITVYYVKTSLADLEVLDEDIKIYPAAPIEGQLVNVSAAVRNRSSMDIKDVVVAVYLWDATASLTLVKSEKIPSVLANSEVIINFSVDTAGKKGLNQILVSVDPDDTIKEANELNNVAIREFVVMSQEGVKMDTTLDASEYKSGQNIGIRIDLANSGKERIGTLETVIEDRVGNKVAAIDLRTINLPYAGLQNIGLSWNTGTFYAGSYRVHSRFKDQSAAVIAENVVPFTILADVNVEVTLTTDKLLYGAIENVFIETGIKSTARNVVIQDISARVSVTDSAGRILFAETKTAASLMPGAVLGIVSQWNTGENQSGDYNANVDIFIGDKLVNSKTAPFRIVKSSSISGDLRIDPVTVASGGIANISFTIHNSGNSSVAGLPVRVIVVDPDTQVTNTVYECVVDLGLDDTKSGVFVLSVKGYSLKTYTLVLQHFMQGNVKTVSSAVFSVRDVLPPVVNIIKPGLGGLYNGKVDLAVNAFDDSSGVDRVEYRIDGGSWMLLPVSDLSSGRYAISWSPVKADEGPRTISFRATDKAGNTSEPISTSVNIDLTPPAPPQITSPADNSTLTMSIVDISGVAEPGSSVKMDGAGSGFAAANAQSGVFIFYGVKLNAAVNAFSFIATDKAGNVSSPRAYTINVLSMTSGVVTDKPQYSINENVNIASTLQSRGSEVSNISALVKIVNSSGQIMFSEEKLVGTIVANQTININSAWLTGTNPAGAYTVWLEVMQERIILGSSSKSFVIIGSSVTGDGLSGTLAVSPASLFQGNDVAFSYTVKNAGNEDTDNLNIDIYVINPDTNEIKASLEKSVSLKRDTDISGNFVLSTANLAPRMYSVILNVRTAAMQSPKVLAVSGFEVKSALEITKKFLKPLNLLVWINDGCQINKPKVDEFHDIKQPEPNERCQEHDNRCINADQVKSILAEIGAGYKLVYSPKDFQTELRNAYYSDIIILGDKYPLEGHYPDELREQIYSGKGLVSSLYFKHGYGEDYRGLLGIEYRGYIVHGDHKIRILKSPISESGMINIHADAVKVEAADLNKVTAWVYEYTDRTTGRCHQDEYPAVVLNKYGHGNTVFFAFDLGDALKSDNSGQLSALLKGAIEYVHNKKELAAYLPNKYIPVELSIKSIGGTFDLRISESYTGGVRLFDVASGRWVVDNPWVKYITLGSGESKTVSYYAYTPDSQGMCSLKTEVEYKENGQYTVYKRLETWIMVEKSMAILNSDILTALKSIKVSIRERSKIDNAARYIKQVQNRKVNSYRDQEQNIQDIISAIESLRSVFSVDIGSIRYMMVSLLQACEADWYVKQ